MSNNQLITILSPDLSYGGAEKVAVNLANSYVEMGFNVELALFKKTGGYLSLLSKKVKVIDLEIERTTFGLFKLRNYISKSKPNLIISVIVEANILLGLVAFTLPNIRTVFRQANTMDLIESKWLPIKVLYKILMKLTYKQSNIVIANSEDTRDDLLKHKIVSKNNCKVISNPVLPFNVFELGNETITDEWLGNNNKIILNVGRLTYQKNQELLIRAMVEIIKYRSDVKLLILGEGELKSQLNQLIISLQLVNYVKIIPPVNNPFPYYRNSDLFVLTSRYEGFGNVLVEALAFGLNIVSTSCNGGPSRILANGKFGVLLDSQCPQELSKSIIQQLTSPLADKQTLRKRASEYKAENIAKNYLDSINER